MYNELDTIVLRVDISEYHLKKGDMGAIVMVYEKGKAYDVEFVATDGSTVAVLKLIDNQIHATEKKSIIHSRELV